MLNRTVDILVGLLLIGIVLPFWVLQCLVFAARGKWWLISVKRLGFKGRQWSQLEARWAPTHFLLNWMNRPLLRRSPVLLHVLAGHMSLVGPKALTLEEGNRLTGELRARFSVKPGLVHTYFLRSSVNIAFQSESRLALKDLEIGMGQRLGMLVRALAAVLFGGKTTCEATDSFRLFGLRFDNRTREQAVTQIIQMIAGREKRRIAFVNPACVNISLNTPSYREALARFDLIYPDGIGIKIACKLRRLNLIDNLNGTDLFPALCKQLEQNAMGMYLLGGRPGVCEEMIKKVKRDFPKLEILGYHHGYLNASDHDRVVDDINQSGAGILLVAMGVPGQELWIDRYFDRLNSRVTMGVGGLFDFVSGRLPRAPLWLREMGLEWAFRFCQEPTRLWRRYLIGNLVFFWNLLRYGK